MRRRWMRGWLVLLLLLTFFDCAVLSAEKTTDTIESADLLLEMEETESADLLLEIEETESVDLVLEIEETESMDSFLQTEEAETEGFLLQNVEEISLIQYEEEASAEQTEEAGWLFGGTVSASGTAADAVDPELSVYSQTVYEASFGEQLEGDARRVYNKMTEVFAGQKKMEDLTIYLEKALQYTNESEKEAVQSQLDYMAQAAFDAFKYDYPEVYWLGLVSYGGYVTKTTMDGKSLYQITKIKISPIEDYTGASLAGEQNAFQTAVLAAVQEISENLTSVSTTEEKVRAIHDYLCDHVVYEEQYASYTENDPQYAYIHSAAGVFLKGGTAVCEGYAKAFKILCESFDIETALITGCANGGGHMWNYVKMEDGNWYLVDVTWDDQKSWISYRYFLTGSLEQNASGITIADERQIYSVFSPSSHTKSFALPVLNAYAYQVQAEHTHQWEKKDEESKAATCVNAGYETYYCVCGAKTVINLELDQTAHSFTDYYVYNQDATYQSDGTKTCYCDYGCNTKGKTITASGTKLVPTYTVNAKSLRLKKGQKTTKFKITQLGVGDYVKAWRTTKKNIVRVQGKQNGTCTIEAKKVGNAEIIATLYSGVEIRLPVKVQKKAVQASAIRNVPKKLTITKGKSKVLTPEIRPITCKKTITFQSKNEKIATVTKNGKIKARKKGKTVITVSCGSVSVTCKVTVK